MAVKEQQKFFHSPWLVREKKRNATEKGVKVPEATEIRTFIGRPSVPHFRISPATYQGQAADAVAALAHARNLRPLALEILCVPRFAHLQKILNIACMVEEFPSLSAK